MASCASMAGRRMLDLHTASFLKESNTLLQKLHVVLLSGINVRYSRVLLEVPIPGGSH